MLTYLTFLFAKDSNDPNTGKCCFDLPLIY